MEKSFPAGRGYNATALKYAGAQLINNSRANNGYPNNQWEATDVDRYDGGYATSDPYSEKSTFQTTYNKNISRSKVMDTLDEFQNDFYNKTSLNTQQSNKTYVSASEANRIKRGLGASQSQPKFATTYNGVPINPFLTPMFAQVQYPVAKLDMDWFIRQCKNFDGLFKKSHKNISYAREKVYNWIANFQTLTHVDTFDGPLHWLPWEDQEIYQILKYALLSEEEMINSLKKMPEGSMMLNVRNK